MDAASAIVDILKREGIDVLFGYPRNRLLEVAAKADIRTIIVRQERIGVHMADALSRMTRGRRPGVFCMQHGPGTENAYGAVAQAFAESVPILVLPQGYARRLAHLPRNFNATRAMSPIAKHCEPLTSGSEVPAVFRRAFTQLRNGRGGPVVVELPWDVFEEVAPEPADYRPAPHARSGPDPEAVARVAARLVAADRPVIYAGQGIHWADAYDELRGLAEHLAIPVATSLAGKSSFDESHPLALGSGGAAWPATVPRMLERADVILGIGCSFMETAFGIAMPPGVKVIHATLDPADLNQTVQVDDVVIGDAKLVLAALNEACRVRSPAPRDRSPVAAEIRALEAGWLAAWRPKLTSDSTPLSPYRVLWELQQIVDKDEVVITHDAGSPRDQLTPFWKSTTPLSYLGWGKSTQLGYGLGLAMGAKLARPEALCINVWGDAAIGFTGMDFETAVRERLPILSILLNNSSMAIELDIMPVATEKYRATDISGDYAALARALGGYGERIVRPDDIAPAIRRGIEQTRAGVPALLEFITGQENVTSRP